MNSRVRKELQPIDADNAVAKMEQKVVRSIDIHGPMDRRNLAKYCNAYRTGEWIFRTALENMINVNLVSLDARTGHYSLTEQAAEIAPKSKAQIVQ